MLKSYSTKYHDVYEAILGANNSIRVTLVSNASKDRNVLVGGALQFGNIHSHKPLQGYLYTRGSKL